MRWTTMKKSATWLALGMATLFGFACNGDNPIPECNNNNNGSGGSTSTGEGGGATTSGAGGNETQGYTPQEVSAKLHHCRKLRYDTLGDILADRGVDTATFFGSGNGCQTDNNGPFCPSGERCYCFDPPCVQTGNDPGNQGMCVAAPESPGFLYSTALDAFSVPKMDSRRGEKDGHTTASAMRLFDIFVQAAPQIIANIENPILAPACVLGGETHPMFDPVDGSCVEESISCLMGTAATEDHVVLCNLILDKAAPGDAADLVVKQHIAVATILAAAHSCE